MSGGTLCKFLRLARFRKDGMPGVAARTAVAPDHHRFAAKHLFDGDVMFRSATRTQMRNARLFRLTR